MNRNKLKRNKWRIKLGVVLLLVSFVLYFINYLIFHDIEHIVTFFTEDLAFIPIEILVVTLIVEEIIDKREKQQLMEKMNMIVGVFFTEMGTGILEFCTKFDPNIDNIRNNMIIKKEWEDSDFNRAIKSLKNYDYSVEIHSVNLEEVKRFLLEKKDFLLRLLENPNLLESETFSELLSAVFHLEQELSNRDLAKLSVEDEKHLQVDIQRIYKHIVFEWIQYSMHLKNKYPYLFLTILYTNPFDLRSDEEIKKEIN